jgi:hypothetical protein
MNRDELLLKLGDILSGLQAPRSVFGARALGAALDPYDAVRAGLGLFGYMTAEEIAARLKEAL